MIAKSPLQVFYHDFTTNRPLSHSTDGSGSSNLLWIDQGPIHTYPDIFENASFFIRFGFASTRRRRFRPPKMELFENAPRVDLCENAVFMLSCGRVKTELFENADVTASIDDVSEHAHGSLGITQGHFDCLFSFVKVRVNAAASSCGRGYFRKRPSCGRGYLFIRIKKDAFSKRSGYVWTRPNIYDA